MKSRARNEYESSYHYYVKILFQNSNFLIVWNAIYGNIDFNFKPSIKKKSIFLVSSTV